MSNGKPTLDEVAGAISKKGFRETEPISTYLFAFAIGPFRPVHHVFGLPDVYVRRSQQKRAEADVPAVQANHSRGYQIFQQLFRAAFSIS